MSAKIIQVFNCTKLLNKQTMPQSDKEDYKTYVVENGWH